MCVWTCVYVFGEKKKKTAAEVHLVKVKNGGSGEKSNEENTKKAEAMQAQNGENKKKQQILVAQAHEGLLKMRKKGREGAKQQRGQKSRTRGRRGGKKVSFCSQ